MKNKIEKDSFITEIEEDLKNDNLKKLWDKYGFYLLATMASVLVITICVEVYSYFKTKSNQALINQYSQALMLKSTSNDDAAAMMFEGLSSEGGFVSDLAQIEEASLMIKQNKLSEAQEKLTTIIANKKIDTAIKNVARMILASIIVDKKSTAEVEVVLAPLFEGNNPWKFNAYEFLAASYLQAGNKEKAIEIFETISNGATNNAIKTRASDMLSVLR